MKRNRILYFSLLIASFVFVYFYGGKIPYMFLNVLIILPFFSIFFVIIIYFRFKYIQEIDKKFILKGDTVNFIFKVFNEDIFLYPYINVSFHGHDTVFANQFKSKYFSLSPFKQKSYSFPLKCNYRGCYEVGISSIDIIDFLGIFKLTYNVFDPKYVTIYPRIVTLERFCLSTVYNSETNSMFDNMPSDTTTISDIK